MTGRRRYTLAGTQRGLVLALLVAITIPIFPALVVGERGVTPFQAVGALLVGVAVTRFLIAGARVRGNWVTWSAALFWAVATASAVSLFLPGVPDSARVDFLTIWAQLTLIVALPVAGSTLVYRDADVRRLVDVYILVAAAVSLYALYQTIARLYGLPLAYLPILNPSLEGTVTRAGVFGGLVRPSAAFTEPGVLGSYLLTPLFLSVFLYRYVEDHTRRTVMFGCALCIAAGLLVAFSLQAYFALTVAVAVGLLSRSVRAMMGRVVLYAGALTAVISVASFFVLDEVFIDLAVHRALAAIDRIVDIGDYGASTIEARLARAGAAVDVWARHPLLGVGLNNTGRFFPPEMEPRVHGAFIQALSEMGPAGPIALFGVVFGSAGVLLRKLGGRRALGWKEAVIGGLAVGLVARGGRMLVASNYLSPFFGVDLLVAAVLMGWIARSRRRERKAREAEAPG